MIRVGRTVYFACDECPIVCQLERRLSIAEEYGFQFDHCGCEKVDAQFYAGGYCEDAFYYFTPQRSRGHRKYGRAYRRAMNAKKRNKRVALASSRYSSIHSGYVDWDYVDGIWSPVGKYVKYSKNSNRQKFWKRYSNKIIRKGAIIGSGKGGYKRCFDYKWEID